MLEPLAPCAVIGAPCGVSIQETMSWMGCRPPKTMLNPGARSGCSERRGRDVRRARTCSPAALPASERHRVPRCRPRWPASHHCGHHAVRRAGRLRSSSGHLSSGDGGIRRDRMGRRELERPSLGRSRLDWCVLVWGFLGRCVVGWRQLGRRVVGRRHLGRRVVGRRVVGRGELVWVVLGRCQLERCQRGFVRMDVYVLDVTRPTSAVQQGSVTV